MAQSISSQRASDWLWSLALISAFMSGISIEEPRFLKTKKPLKSEAKSLSSEGLAMLFTNIRSSPDHSRVFVNGDESWVV